MSRKGPIVRSFEANNLLYLTKMIENMGPFWCICSLFFISQAHIFILLQTAPLLSEQL